MGFAAVGVASTVAGVAVMQPASTPAPLVDLAALIVVGSSTHPSGSGNEDFYHGMFDAPPYNTGDDLMHVNFFTGPFGINRALQDHSGETNAVLSSGWGAANASLLLMALQAKKEPDLPQTLFVLDNNVARPDGGFGTRYPWFALIGVNPLPSPTDTDALGVVDVGYEYDYNSNAPADVFNAVAAVNSLVAYTYRHLNQNDLDLPVKPDGSPAVSCGTANTCGITDNGVVLECPDAHCDTVPAGDRVAVYVTQRGNTTYVTYTSDGLPLTNLIRDVVPFGDVIADRTEPALTAIVDAAYPNGNPIPADPSKYQPATPFSSVPNLVAKVHGTPASAPAATATTVATATDQEPTGQKKKIGKITALKPLINLVRHSVKAVPRSGAANGDSGDATNPADVVAEPTKGEHQTETTPSRPRPNESNDEAAGAAQGDDS
ncbi:MAG TPA: PE-PPE domain-containing protein [Mycobacterium sp.]|nr:PE-PPE domain-containing protein [Mycobacterium sp.]